MQNITSYLYSFEELRNGKFLYVDKTEYIRELLRPSAAGYFLARPRRFGKSLTISTLKAIFEGKKHLFDGLAISKTDYDWKTYPVIHLSFADLTASAKTAEGVKDYLVSKVNQQAAVFGMELTEKEPGLRLGQLMTELAKKGQVVVLVDEYDKPLIDNIQSPHVEEIRDELKCFYGVLKDRNSLLRLLFVTGVTKFCHVSLFSGVNNLTDISMHADYAAMLGYTQSELETNFAEYIALACQKTGMIREKLLSEIKQWYNGYRFEETAETVYNPVSLAKFFENNYKFSNYWFATGTPTFLMKLVKENKLDIEKTLAEPISALSFEAFEVDSIDPVTLLLQTGYLTIKSTEKKYNRMFYRLDFPNIEVGDSFNTYLLNAYTGKSKREVSVIAEKLADDFEAGNLQQVYNILDSFFAGISYEVHHNDESNFHNIFVTIFRILGYYIEAEYHTSDGRIDAVIETDKNVFIFEFKLNKDKTALSQIKDKEYHKKYELSDKSITLAGINFDTETGILCGMETEVLK